MSNQLTRTQSSWKHKLELKARKGEIHVSPSDKGKGIVAMDLDLYDQMASKHTEKDRKVTWKELDETQMLSIE